MKEIWEKELSCATGCSTCSRKLDPSADRILSVYSHEPICMECKDSEEKRPDYPENSKRMIEQCMNETELAWGDPGGYCYHHFYAFKC